MRKKISKRKVSKAVRKLAGQSRPDCPRCGSVNACKGCKLGNESYSGKK